jgi:hypothetical protein
MKEAKATFSFTKKYDSLTRVLVDHDLASLGDAFINLAYSLALSNRKGKPIGVKVKGSALATALRNAGLRAYLPARMTRHSLADAAEALVVYGWLQNHIGLGEVVEMLEKGDDLVENLSLLLVTICEKVKIS